MNSYRKSMLKELMEIIRVLSDKNLRRLLLLAKGLAQNGD